MLPSLEKAKKRGVSIRFAAPINLDNVKVAKELSRVAEVRDTSGTGVKGRFAIIDNAQLMFMLLDDKTVHPNYDIAVWLSTEFFANSLKQVFDNSWKQFAPLGKVKLK